MAKHIHTILAASLSLTLSTAVFASDVEVFKENQGEKVEEFNSDLIAGQWVVETKNADVTDGFQNNPEFLVITNGDLDPLKKKIDMLKASGDSNEQVYYGNIYYDLKSVLEKLFLADEYNKKFDENGKDIYFTYGLGKEYRKIEDEYEKANSADKTFYISFFNKDRVINNYDAFAIFNYTSIKNQYDSYKGSYQNIEDNMKSTFPDFDWKNEVDFILMNKGSNLYGLDYVDNNTIIFYNFQSQDAVVLKRPDETIKPLTYNQLFKSIDRKYNN